MIYRWPDGTECDPDQLEEMLTFMSDDFEIILDDSDLLQLCLSE